MTKKQTTILMQAFVCGIVLLSGVCWAGYADTYATTAPAPVPPYYSTIQAAVDNVNANGTVHVLNGTYTAGCTIDTRSNITITGESRDGAIIQPSSTATPPLISANGHQAAFYFSKSPHITIQDLTIDMDLARQAGAPTGIYGRECDQLLVQNVVIKNINGSDAAGHYSEEGVRLDTFIPNQSGLSCGTRAHADVLNCFLHDTGRIGVHAVSYTDVTINNCVFDKDLAKPDFGYGVAVGQGSTGIIENSTFRGFGTSAQADNSGSGAFNLSASYATSSYGVANCTLTVNVINCQAYDSTMGAAMGDNTSTGASSNTNIDLIINFQGCTFENNVYGMTMDNAGADHGDSLTVNCFGCVFNGSNQLNLEIGDAHGWIPSGNSDITANFQNNTFENSNVGVQFDLSDTGDKWYYYGGCYGVGGCGSGSYVANSNLNLTFNNNNFANNGVDFQDDNTGDPATTINLDNNYWGQTGGPTSGDLQGAGAPGAAPSSSIDNPQTDDNDGDGLKNWEEDKNMNGVLDAGETNPNNPDTDGDGFSDGVEVRAGTNPRDPLSYPTGIYPGDGSADTDHDGYKDAYEYAAGFDWNSAASHPHLGDVNGNGSVDNVDAVIIFAVYLGNADISLYDYNRMDLDRNGHIDNVDATGALNFFLGNIAALPLN